MSNFVQILDPVVEAQKIKISDARSKVDGEKRNYVANLLEDKGVEFRAFLPLTQLESLATANKIKINYPEWILDLEYTDPPKANTADLEKEIADLKAKLAEAEAQKATPPAKVKAVGTAPATTPDPGDPVDPNSK